MVKFILDKTRARHQHNRDNKLLLAIIEVLKLTPIQQESVVIAA